MDFRHAEVYGVLQVINQSRFRARCARICCQFPGYSGATRASQLSQRIIRIAIGGRRDAQMIRLAFARDLDHTGAHTYTRSLFASSPPGARLPYIAVPRRRKKFRSTKSPTRSRSPRKIRARAPVAARRPAASPFTKSAKNS